MRTAAIVVALGLATAVAGCAGLGDPTGAACPTDSTLSYDNFGQAFFTQHCTSCHNAADQSPAFDTVEKIRAEATNIDRAAGSGPKGTNTYMPESGNVPTPDREQLSQWLACGAP